MTEIDQRAPYFDVRQSVQGRNITRMVVAPLLSAGLIWLGVWLIPDTAVIKLRIESIETWNVWVFFGAICIGSGIYGLIKELVFSVRAWSTSGEWHFRLTETHLQWDVPDHAHGAEEGFAARLDEMKMVEFRTIHKQDDMDQREYWVHFYSRDPVQLRSYSGVSLPWLVGKIGAAGVPYKETHQDY